MLCLSPEITSRYTAGEGSGWRSSRGARVASEATGRVGTSFYISPEIRDGWARYDERTGELQLLIT